MRVYDGAGNPVKGNRNIPMPERVQRVVQNGDQCPGCRSAGTYHKHKNSTRSWHFCTNCGYTDNLLRGEVK